MTRESKRTSLLHAVNETPDDNARVGVYSDCCRGRSWDRCLPHTGNFYHSYDKTPPQSGAVVEECWRRCLLKSFTTLVSALIFCAGIAVCYFVNSTGVDPRLRTHRASILQPGYGRDSCSTLSSERRSLVSILGSKNRVLCELRTYVHQV